MYLFISRCYLCCTHIFYFISFFIFKQNFSKIIDSAPKTRTVSPIVMKHNVHMINVTQCAADLNDPEDHHLQVVLLLLEAQEHLGIQEVQEVLVVNKSTENHSVSHTGGHIYLGSMQDFQLPCGPRIPASPLYPAVKTQGDGSEVTEHHNLISETAVRWEVSFISTSAALQNHHVCSMAKKLLNVRNERTLQWIFGRSPRSPVSPFSPFAPDPRSPAVTQTQSVIQSRFILCLVNMSCADRLVHQVERQPVSRFTEDDQKSKQEEKLNDFIMGIYIFPSSNWRITIFGITVRNISSGCLAWTPVMDVILPLHLFDYWGLHAASEEM